MIFTPRLDIFKEAHGILFSGISIRLVQWSIASPKYSSSTVEDSISSVAPNHRRAELASSVHTKTGRT